MIFDVLSKFHLLLPISGRELLQALANWALERPFYAGLLLLTAYLLYKVVTFREIVIDFKDEVPKAVRRAATATAVAGGESGPPPPFPNGWIPVLESRALGPGQVKSVLAFGQELAVVRGATGQVYVLDAFCPHLGANLAVGGTVEQRICSSSKKVSGDDNNNNNGKISCNGKAKPTKEDCIRCPFHGWSFRMSDGQCADIPYEEAPVNAKVKLWTSLERNNVIFVWYQADQDEQPKPSWTPEVVQELTTGKWVYQGRTEHLVNCHIQEIPENGADIAHLNSIHVDSFLLGSDLDLLNRLRRRWLGVWLSSSLLTHEWAAQWAPCPPPDAHMATIELVNATKFFGWTLFTVNLAVRQIGPAYVELRFQAKLPFRCMSSRPLVTGVFLQFVKPIGPMRNSIVHQVYTEGSVLGYIFGKFLILAEARMLERDIRIWNRKAFLRRPYVAKSEKALVKYRRWFLQFYSSSQPETTKTASKTATTIDW